MYPTSKIAGEFTALPNAPAVPDDLGPPGVPIVGASDIFLKSSDFIKSRVPGQEHTCEKVSQVYTYSQRLSTATRGAAIHWRLRLRAFPLVNPGNRSVSLSCVHRR